MNKDTLVDILFPSVDKDVNYYLQKFSKRDLDKKAIVTRFGPSPTGFLHVGSLFSAFVSLLFAKQSHGVAFLRIEDTDTKRKVDNAAEKIKEDLNNFGIYFDEGPNNNDKKYGPFIQSKRKEIYNSFAKEMVKKDLAYPCFCSEEELDEIRKNQEINKELTGYYGKWAKCRNLGLKEIKQNIEEGKKFTIKLKSPGDYNKKIEHNDLVKGKVTFPENFLDIVILKTNKLPTYHFAHLVDDLLMGTTHVIRGDEWLSSIPVHTQLFEMLKFNKPKYAHFAPIMKMDENGKKRKLSKRLDKEAQMSYYHQRGIPKEVLKIYLATLANSNFEEWYNQNKGAKIEEFKFSFNKMSNSGPLFDIDKLNNIARIYFSRLKAAEIYNRSLEYFSKYDPDFYNLLKKEREKAIKILDVERNIKKPRKDIASFSDVKKINWYLFDDLFYKENPKELYQNLIKENDYDIESIENYIKSVCISEEKSEWFQDVKNFANKRGYATSNKDYKENPLKYKGTIGTFCESLRQILTSKTKTPDLHQMLLIIGKENSLKRIEKFKEYYEKVKN